MQIDWTRSNLRLAANPFAVARQVESLPPVAMCILRLLDGKKTVKDALNLSPVDEHTARAILRRLIDLGLASPVTDRAQPDEPRPRSLSEPMKAWIAKSKYGARASDASAGPASAAQGEARRATNDGNTAFDMSEVDSLFAELAEDEPASRPAAPRPAAPPPIPAHCLRSPRLGKPKRAGQEPSRVLAVFAPPAPHRTGPATLEEALRCHVEEEPEGEGGFTEQDRAFFESYRPEEPMTDTFSDLLSRPRRR
ncbi:MAG: hypothetical protein RBU30_19660 [Polyangia bacterium]|jgi:hypothetical protein|nr:hypothetical protein [Polyangia bacterium]